MSFYKPEDFYSANHWGKDGPTDEFYNALTEIANSKLEQHVKTLPRIWLIKETDGGSFVECPKCIGYSGDTIYKLISRTHTAVLWGLEEIDEH